MMARYVVVASRIRQELADIDHVVARAERAMAAVRRRPEDKDLYLDSAALSLHDFYAGLERVFRQIAATVDGSVPSGPEWHREVLRQMTVTLPDIRPQVLSAESANTIDEYLSFRHVVRNVYAFEFDLERIARLVQNARPYFDRVRDELLAFANFLDQLLQEE